MFHAMKFLLIAAQTPNEVEYERERPSYNPPLAMTNKFYYLYCKMLYN